MAVWQWLWRSDRSLKVAGESVQCSDRSGVRQRLSASSHHCSLQQYGRSYVRR